MAMNITLEASSVDVYCPYSHVQQETTGIRECTSPPDFPCYGPHHSPLNVEEILRYLLDEVDGKHEY